MLNASENVYTIDNASIYKQLINDGVFTFPTLYKICDNNKIRKCYRILLSKLVLEQRTR